MGKLAAILASGDIDGVASAVIAARAADGPVELLFSESQHLVRFFGNSVQDKLPRRYNLIICGLEVVHTSWDGELVRPRLMDLLRAFMSPVLWFSSRAWRPEDRAAVESIVGAGNLLVNADAPCTAALVHSHFARPDDEYAALMEELAAGRLPDQAEAEWGAQWRRVITSFKGDLRHLREAVEPLVDARPTEIPDALLERATRTEQENRELAERSAEEPVQVGEHKLACIDIPRERHAFWREISGCSLALTGAHFCLCHLIGRPVLILTRNDKERADLRTWARYLTDLLPAARAIGESPEVVPIYLRGLDQDPALKREAIEILQQGAHLLAM